MSNIRNLKKDIELLSRNLVANICFMNHLQQIETEKASELVVKASAFRKNAVARANNPVVNADKKDAKAYAKAVRAAYRQQRVDILNEYAEIAKELGLK